MKFYHGGVRGLKVGDEILPPSVTKTERTLLHFLESGVEEGAINAADITQRADRVYLGAKWDVAYLYASVYPWDGGGAIYEVEPIGIVEPDPDCSMPGLSWQAEKARVTRVINSCVTFKPSLAGGVQ